MRDLESGGSEEAAHRPYAVKNGGAGAGGWVRGAERREVVTAPVAARPNRSSAGSGCAVLNGRFLARSGRWVPEAAVGGILY